MRCILGNHATLLPFLIFMGYPILQTGIESDAIFHEISLYRPIRMRKITSEGTYER